MEMARVHRAAGRIAGRVRRTPLLRSTWLSDLVGGDVFLKCENLQVTGSFKIRGAYAAVGDPSTGSGQAARPVVAASAGNHGIALATAARDAGVPCTIVVPRGVPAVKEEKIRALGATLLKSPFDGYDDTEAWARERAGGARWVSAYDDPDVIAGNGGTTAQEILDEADVEAVVVPCGGGGLAIGSGLVKRTIAVNTDASCAMWASWRDGRAHERFDSRPTIAEGLEGGVSRINYERSREFVADVLVVPEASIGPAVRDVALRERMVIEGSAAAGVAAVVAGKIPHKRFAVVLTGSNIDASRFAALLA